MVGLDPVTTAYHSADLALLLPCDSFTNHYHRDGGQATDVSVGGSVAGWAMVVRVIEG